MKILHTVHYYYPHIGGCEVVVQQLSERLAAKGHDVTVATSFDSTRDFDELNGVKIVQFKVSGNAVGGIQGDAQAYADFIQLGGWDVMMTYAAQIWSTDIPLAISDRLKFKKFIVPCGYSALSSPAFQGYFQWLSTVLPKYDGVIHLSPDYRDAQFSKQYGMTNSTVIPNGADEREFSKAPIGFRKKYGVTTPHMLLAVANHYPEKGHDRVISAYKALDRDDVTLVIIGQSKEGCYSECERKAKGDNILLPIDVPRELVVSAFQEADIFVHGSYVECFPLVILEAMAAGTPWLSTNVGNVAELPGGIADDNLTDQLKLLIDDEKNKEKLGNVGSDRWRSQHTWSAVADQYEATYLDPKGHTGRL